MLNNSKNSVVLNFIDFLALSIIGLICIGYIVLGSSFAETNLTISFFNFPIFIGEILIIICLFFLMMKFFYIENKKISLNSIYIAAYFFFLFSLSVFGYVKYGPLSFRHAALFYYHIFIIFGYCFFNIELIKRMKYVILAISFYVVLFVNGSSENWMLSFLFIFLIFFLKIKKRIFKSILLFIFCFNFPIYILFQTSRMMLVSNIVSILFLMVSLLLSNKNNRKIKILLILIFFAGISIGILKIADKNAVKSIFAFNTIKDVFLENDRIIKENAHLYNKEKKLNVKLYNPNKKEFISSKDHEYGLISFENMTVHQVNLLADFNLKDINEFDENADLKEKISEADQDVNTDEVSSNSKDRVLEPKLPIAKEFRDYFGACTNIVFRLFIWRDIFVDLFNEKAFFGFGFGRPLRSQSLEILKWGINEWNRDGWIEAHNSYFNMIYRLGLISCLIICFFVFKFVEIAKFFIKNRKNDGIFLLTILIGWFASANFLVTLELPYTAIPVWTLFGILIGYFDYLRNERKNESINCS